MLRRAVAIALALVSACGDGSGPGGGGGNYQTVVGDDWSSYTSSADLLATFGWGSTGASSQFTVAQNVHLVADPVFGQVVETRQPMDTNTQVCCGWSPLKFVAFPQLLNKVWFRARVRFSAGWTPEGPIPVGAANSYKLLFILWQGYSQRAEIEFSNNTQYIIGFGFQGVTCNSATVPGAAPWGNVTTEWTDEEWWEYIMYYEKTGGTSARQRFWKRQLTVSGALDPQPFEFTGETKTNCSSATPQARAINLGANKNKTTPADQYIYWGPFEVVNGVQYPNPWGVGP